MDLNAQKEKFSEAYVLAVAATAGYSTYKYNLDDDSVDLGIAARTIPQPNGTIVTRSPRLEVQLKCTASPIPSSNHISFSLKVKNYNDLKATDFVIPRILVVVLVPDNVTDWIQHSEAEMCIRRCGYWVSLRGEPATNNTTNIKIEIPRQNLFTVQALQAIMQRLAQGGLP
jgi:hypothetical protein